MTVNEKLENSIGQQFMANGKRNLFYDGLDSRNFFLPATKELLKNHKLDFLQMEADKQSSIWIDRMTNESIRLFCNTNQYLDLRKEHLAELRKVYQVLWQEIISELKKEDIDFDSLQKSHVQRLADWLCNSNPFIQRINKPDMQEVVGVVCSQYSAELQLELLNINLSDLMEPVLDIGCGENATLVEYLRGKGIKAFGIDRLCNSPADYLSSSNWLEFEYIPGSWGTIISNHSFALHFNHHHERLDGDYLIYARKYMEILNSLIVGGTFYYAPALHFIEPYLPPEQYRLKSKKVNDLFSSSSIRRLKYL